MDRRRALGSVYEVGRWARRPVGRVVACGVAVVLAVTLGDVVRRPDPVSAAPAGPPAGQVVDVPLERPDEQAALTTARVTGRRVKITDMTSETAEYFALPEGQIEATISSGIVRVRRDGDWVPVDLSLVRDADGGVSAKADPFAVRLSGARPAGEHELVGIGVGADRLSVGWSGALPEPVLDGSRATYVDAMAGVDLVVDVGREGVETFLVVKSREAASRVAKLTLPVTGRNAASFTRDAGGNTTIRDRSGRTVATVPAPEMWDAKRDAADQPTDRAAVASRVVSRSARSGSEPGIVLALTPDTQWLTDPARVYPATIDPQLNPVSVTFDTYVQANMTSDRSGENDLRFGRVGSTGPVSRSFVHWGVSALRGHTVTSATVYFWNWFSSTCAAKSWGIWSTGPASTATRWTNQPAWNTLEATSTATKGFDASCADGWVSISGTSFFNRAAQALQSTAYMGIRATSETDWLYFKQVRSQHADNAGHVPYAVVTYNAGATVTARSTVPSTSCVVGSGRPFVNTATPQLKARVTDPEGAPVRATYEWWPTGGSPVIGSSTQGPGASGSWLPAAVVPAGQLSDGSNYSWRVRGLDGLGAGLWSSWCEFAVDTTPPAAAPAVSSSNYAEGQWGGGAGTAAAFTFGASGVSDVASYEYDLDVDPPAQSVTATALGGGASVSVPVTADGPHTLYVRSVDRAGSRSATKAYAFNAGSGGVTAPRTGDITAAKTAIITVTAPAVASLTYQWRRGDADAWTDIPAGDVTKAVGGGAVTWPLPTTGGGQFEKLNWDVAKTLNDAEAGDDPLDGPFQLRALFDTGAGPSPVVLTFDKNNAAAATESAGPCTVNLITGNCGADDTDVSVDSYGTDLTVTRSYNTRQAAKTDTANLFGPGWVSGVTVEDADAPYTSLSRTGSLVQVGLPEGDTIGFAKKANVTGGESFTPEIGLEDLTLTHTTASDSYTLSDLDGNTTTFTRISGAPSGLYNPTAVTVPGSGQTTTVSWQSATVGGATVVRPTRMLAPVPDGVNCATVTRGCRALNLSYATATTAAGAGEAEWGDYAGRVKEITFTAWDPDLVTPAMRTVAVARYTYDDAGRLRATWDPRLDWSDEGGAHHLRDRYTYGASGLLTGITPNAQPPWNLVYTTVPADSGAGRLASVTRGLAVTGADGAGPLVSAVNPDNGRLCVDIFAADTTDGTEVQTFTCNGTGAQSWALHADGTVRALGKCLNVDGSGTGEGTPVNLWTCDGSAGQQWTPGTDGSLVNPSSGRCLAIPGSSTDIGIQLQILTCDGADAQRWSSPVSTVVYRVPTSGTGAPYDLSGAQTARWAQTEPPTDAAAVFPPTQIPTGSQATGTVPSSFERATVTYLDANARQVDTAQPGGGVTTTWYDQFGNVTRELTAGNRQAALNASGGDAAAQEAELAKRTSTLNVYSSDGQQLTATWMPERDVLLDDGTIAQARPRTTNTYDEGAPSGGPYNLATTADSHAMVFDNGAWVAHDARVTKTEYDWTLRQPTKVTQDFGGLGLATRTGYDPVTGLVTATTTPRGGAVDTTPSTRITVYYRAGSGSGYSGCDLRPEWANLPCRVQPGGQSSAGPELPVTVTTYDMFNQPRVVAEETSAGILRTTTTTYDAAGRPYEEAVTAAAGLGTAVPTQRTVYDRATGEVTRTQSIDGGGAVSAEVVRQYDALGRLTGYTDGDGVTSTTTYDLMSRPATTGDGKATRTFSYDGGGESRGLLTGVTDSQAGAFTASYDADGRPVTQTWPTGITATTGYDPSGAAVGLTYTMPGCGQPDCTLYTETVLESGHGQWREHTSTLSRQTYGYDNVGRLTTVEDTVGGDCTTRTYGYDTASNRTATAAYGPDAGGACQASTPATSATFSYDTADRITTTGTVYDALGRTTTVPAAGTTNPAGGDVTVAYHHSDLVRTITQGARTTTYNLDVSGERIRSWTDDATGTAVAATHHYDSDDDTPSWTQETATDYTRTVGAVGGLAGIYGSGEATVDWQLSNLHGDLVATITGADQGVSATHEATEYGTMRDPADTGTRRYGWLGAKQRAADTPTGIILMGVRLYNTTTGRFLTVDPVYGGSCDSYDYTCGDPVNKEDLDGKWIRLAIGIVKASCKVGRWCARSAKWAGKRTWRGLKWAGKGLRRGIRWGGKVWWKSFKRKARVANAFLFGRKRTHGFQGILNRWGVSRIGWSWNARKGRNVFSLHGGYPKPRNWFQRIVPRWHIDIWG